MANEVAGAVEVTIEVAEEDMGIEGEEGQVAEDITCLSRRTCPLLATLR